MRASNPRDSYPYEALKEIKGLEEEIERLTRANRTAGNCNDSLAKSCDNLKADVARLTQERDEALRMVGINPVFKRAADRLADEVAVLIRQEVISSRSPAGDALLDFRDPPQTERSDRLWLLEIENARLHAQADGQERTGGLNALDMRPVR